MIVKYMNDGIWGYIDNIRQVASKLMDVELCVKRYDESQSEFEKIEAIEPGTDSATHLNGRKLPQDIAITNKVFLVACNDLPDEGVNRHAENLIMLNMLESNYPIYAVLAYLEDCKEYDAILLVTNQRLFLMNDKGQTIERLV